MRPDLHLEAGRFQNSGQFGIYRRARHGNFALQCNQPCDYNLNQSIKLSIYSKNNYPSYGSVRFIPFPS